MTTCTIVTGAASGIGAACVDVLLARGDAVLAVDYMPIVRQHPLLQTYEMDITTPHAAEQACAQVLAWQRHVTGFVHAAGINRLCHPFDVDETHWDAVMNVNAKAAWFWTSTILNYMTTQRAGSVVLLASIAGKMASTIQHPVYNVSKAALIALTKTWAHTVASTGVRVNCVCPGVIDTPMQAHVTASMVDATHTQAQVIQQRIAKVPMGRMGRATEVASVVAFLLSDHASYIHGQALNIDGGMISY